jgi:23S rRNA pseudouridine2605 synthase/16S rRNA pseudouridine516 synthase
MNYTGDCGSAHGKRKCHSDGGDGDSAGKRVKRLGEKMKLGGRLKQLGYGQSSNRKIRKLLKSRRVYVNGVVETNISRKVTEDFEVTVLTADSGEAETILPTLPKIFVYNKPCGVVSSFNGDLGRLDLAQSLPKEILSIKGLHNVGRLDQHSTGLLIFTNDGNLTRTLLSGEGISRKYVCVCRGGVLDVDQLRRHMNDGVDTRFGKLRGKLLSAHVLNDNSYGYEHRFCEDDVVRQDGPSSISENHRKDDTISEISLILYEGKKRHVRRMLAHLNHQVLNLRRVAYGPFQLGDLKPGSIREPTQAESRWLKELLSHSNQSSTSSQSTLIKDWGGGGSMKVLLKENILKLLRTRGKGKTC